jgi:hypothetical protein
MADKLNDVLAEVKAAMAAEETATQPDAPDGEIVEEATAEVETPAEDGTPSPEVEPEAPAAPAAPAVDYSAMLAQQTAAIHALQKQLADRDAMVEQQNKRVEKTVEEALEMPTLDIGDLAYEDPAELGKKLNEYNARLAEYNKKVMEAEIAPIKQRYLQAEAEAAVNAAKSRMRGDSRFADFDKLEGKIDALIKRDSDLSKMAPAKAYTTAYLLAKGIEAGKPAPTRSATDIAEEALANDEVMRIINERRLAEVAAKQKDTPKMPGGSAPTPATPVKSPKTLADARALAMGAYKKI